LAHDEKLEYQNIRQSVLTEAQHVDEAWSSTQFLKTSTATLVTKFERIERPKSPFAVT